MASCLILADDFTGACDTGLAFARAGLRTFAVTGSESARLALMSSDVVALDTESRPCSPADAASRVRESISGLGDACPGLAYKKVDSALRGNLASEVREAMRSLDLDLCLMAPAFPDAGRVTAGGYHLVHGVPVERTEVGKDPGSPVRGSFLPHLLEGDPETSIHVIQLEDVAEGAGHIAAMAEGMRGSGPTLVVLDAASNEDLRQIALAAAKIGPTPLLCGSAGLAAHLAEAFALRTSFQQRTPETTASGPVLFVSGTGESTTQRQISGLRARSGVPGHEIHILAVSSDVRDGRISDLQKRVTEELTGELERTGLGVLSLVGIHEAGSREPVARGLRFLATVVRDVLRSVNGAQLAVTGGWTALEVLGAMTAASVEILSECEAGVPISRVADGPFEGRRIVTKGGAIGDDETFVRVLETLKTRPGAGPATEQPILGITMGDPCGVGPEIIAKALCRPEPYDLCRPLVIGHPEILREQLRFTKHPDVEVREVTAPEEGAYRPGTIDVLSPTEVDLGQLETGAVREEGGRAAVAWVLAGIELAMEGRIGGIVTAPLNKEAMNRAGFHYAGHTELLAERTEAVRARLMLASEKLSVAHVTGHMALKDVPKRLTTEEVLETTRLLNDALVTDDRPRPKIVVLGLNPHAGEAGLFGDEDEQVIRPAVEQACADGIDASGPLPADATFFKAYAGEYDGVVAMYHDQGHVPMKLVAFETAVNVTLGLPIVRTSVDHGTAFDIAGKGIAKEGNLIEAIREGARLAMGRADGRRQTAKEKH